MSGSLTYQEARAPARDQAHTLFAQTMGYVAATAGLFALGAYLGRNLPGGAGIAAFACLLGMQFAVRRSQQLTVGLLAASIFLDILNVFLFFLQILSRQE